MRDLHRIREHLRRLFQLDRDDLAFRLHRLPHVRGKLLVARPEYSESKVTHC